MSGQRPSAKRLWRVVPPVIVALATIVPIASARARMSSDNAGVFLGGFTAQHEPVAIEVAKTWRRIPMMRIALDMHCTSGNTPVFTDSWARLPIGPHGGV